MRKRDLKEGMVELVSTSRRKNVGGVVPTNKMMKYIMMVSHQESLCYCIRLFQAKKKMVQSTLQLVDNIGD